MNDMSYPLLPEDNMPPLPREGERGPQACAIIQLYLGVLDDIPADTVQRVFHHVQGCETCSRYHRLMFGTTKAVAKMEGSTPSARVDQAVMAAIAARRVQSSPVSRRNSAGLSQPIKLRRIQPQAKKRRKVWIPASLAAAAVLVVGLLTLAHFFLGTPDSTYAFSVPDNVTWNSYVLYHSETRVDGQGEQYQVETYHNLQNGMMHVETMMGNSMDVVAVGDDHKMLGMDMMHHVASWNADSWANVDDSIFDLNSLRTNLKNGNAVYLGKDTFRGQEVYRIRYKNGDVLLLDMNYHPVNVLKGASAPGTGKPVYNKVILMPQSQVPNDMWNMDVPTDFHMGQLPDQP